MIEALFLILGFFSGYFIGRHRATEDARNEIEFVEAENAALRAEYHRITDRDSRGRFVKAEK